MKKNAILIPALCIVLGLSACGSADEKTSGPEFETIPSVEAPAQPELAANAAESRAEAPEAQETEAAETPAADNAAEPAESPESKKDDNAPTITNDGLDPFYDAMDAFYGEYSYSQSTDGLDGTLSIIQEFDNSREYSIYDSNSNGYRFIALGSNVEFIKGARMYMKYPENVYADGTAVFKYYVIEKQGDSCSLFETDKNYQNPVFIYTAERSTEE